MTTVREAYDGAAGAWGKGPDLVYGTLAAALLARGPAWKGLLVLDVGAGTGTATRRLAADGAHAVAVDAAVEMLSVARGHCACTPIVGDALALPLLTGSVDAAVMGFLLNHLRRPAEALREAARVVRPGGWVLASTWARSNDQTVRQIVQRAMLDRGWCPPAWYQELQDTTTPLSDTAVALELVALNAGLTEVEVAQVEVAVPATPRDLLEWRWGLPHTAPFVAAMPAPERTHLRQKLEGDLTGQPPLVCTVVLLRSGVP